MTASKTAVDSREQTRKKMRRELLRDLRAETKFIREHLGHMDLSDLASVAMIIDHMRGIHSETQCFTDCGREGLTYVGPDANTDQGV